MATVPGVRGGIRIRPAPPYDPPYDDQQSPQWWVPGVVQPLLELEQPAAGRRRDGSPASPPSSPSANAPPPTVAAATRFVNTCLEILNGYRPVTHFRVLSCPLAAANVLASMTQAFRRLRQAGGQAGAGRDRLVTMRAMRTCQPRPGVVEIAVVIGTGTGARRAGRTGQRVWALAYRLERRHGRWLCTAAHML